MRVQKKFNVRVGLSPYSTIMETEKTNGTQKKANTRYAPKVSSPNMVVTCFRFVRSTRFITTWHDTRQKKRGFADGGWIDVSHHADSRARGHMHVRTRYMSIMVK